MGQIMLSYFIKNFIKIKSSYFNNYVFIYLLTSIIITNYFVLVCIIKFQNY